MVETPAQDLLAEKPEIFIPFDDRRLDELGHIPNLTIGEIAGRDSIAAILKSLEDDTVGAILPIAVYTGTEYGDWQSSHRNTAFLRQAAQRRFGKLVLDLAWMGSPPLWWALNGRFITAMVQRFGRYSPCLGCHFYLHAVRIPLAVRLGCTVVVGGDRERHDGTVKINQMAPVLDAYERFFRRFGLELRQPLRAVDDTTEIDAILGPAWPGQSPQPRCVLSGNYRALDDSAGWAESEVIEFIDGFAHPVLERIIAGLVEGRSMDYQQVVKEHLSL
ncbi:MAG TPA: hypothetical protein EYP49_04320 [Anaerolineae bacterium]|nr:hypothetical protein [Anaerolineae bacterium]